MIALHGGGATAAMLLPVPAWVAGLLLGLVAISLYHHLTLHVLLSRSASIVRLVWTEREWLLFTRAGRQRVARLCPDSYVHPYLMVLNFELGAWRRRSVVLLPDESSEPVLRRLRVRLKLTDAAEQG